MQRTFGFYYLISVFLFSLLFVHAKTDLSTFIKTPSSSEDLSKDEKTNTQPKRRQLIEVLDEGALPDLSRDVFFGAKNQRGKNQSPRDPSQAIPESSSSSSKSADNQSATTSSSFLQELAHTKQIEADFPRTPSSLSPKLQKEFRDPKSHYFQGQSVRKLNLQMDQNGEFSVNVMAFPGAEYMIRVAKSIFRYWVDFLPAEMIQMGFIKTDGLGSLQAILAFSSKGATSSQYSVDFLKPFLSKTLNQRTIGAFAYYQMPMDDHIRIRDIGVEIKIYRDTLAVSANFEFRLWNT